MISAWLICVYISLKVETISAETSFDSTMLTQQTPPFSLLLSLSPPLPPWTCYVLFNYYISPQLSDELSCFHVYNKPCSSVSNPYIHNFGISLPSISLSLSLQNANTFCQNTLPPWQCCILKLCTFHTSMRRRPLCPKTKMLYCYSLGCGATVLSIALKAPLVLHVQQEPRGFQGLFLWDIKHMR